MHGGLLALLGLAEEGEQPLAQTDKVQRVGEDDRHSCASGGVALARWTAASWVAGGQTGVKKEAGGRWGGRCATAVRIPMPRRARNASGSDVAYELRMSPWEAEPKVRKPPAITAPITPAAARNPRPTTRLKRGSLDEPSAGASSSP